MSSSSTEQAKAGSPKVAYLMSRFPKVTETFILYEILEMERLGVTVEIYPLLRGRERIVHAEAHDLVARARFQPFLSLSVIGAQWHFIRRRPRAYLGALAAVLAGTLGSANFFFGALGIFPKAVRFAYEMESRNIQHVHAHFANHPAVAALIIHRLIGVPFSFTARGSDIHVDRTMLRQKLEAAAFAITVSSYNKALMVDEGGDHVRDKIHVIYGGVDTDRLSPRAGAEPDGPFRILCVARFEEVKGHACLVEACRLLRDRGVRFECHLIGDGPLWPTVEKQIARAGLAGHVEAPGACPYAQVVEGLAKASVVVLATVPASSGKREGIPNVLKEAMACGLPVVASAMAGIPELVEHERSGLLVSPSDPAALADALQRLEADPVLRHQMGRAGREKVVREFNLRRSTARRAALFGRTVPP
ncbi:MAG: glycosyltransferase [Planctomycetota bacterium]|jgi:glycosyltransferase involved in cell wall biosynthesis